MQYIRRAVVDGYDLQRLRFRNLDGLKPDILRRLQVFVEQVLQDSSRQIERWLITALRGTLSTFLSNGQSFSIWMLS